MGINRELLLMTIIQLKNKDFGKLIKSKRKQKKLTQKKLCDLVDIAVIYLSKIENGHVIPSQKIQSKLLAILDPIEKEPAEIIKEVTLKQESDILRQLYNSLHKIFKKEKGENNVI